MAAAPQPQKRKVWIIRAGKQAEIVSELLEKSVIAIGWSEIGDFPVKDDWGAFRAEVRKQKWRLCRYSRQAHQASACGYH